MSRLPPFIQLLPMELEDIEQVVGIDQRSFPLPWSVNSYRHELTQNPAAHFTVALDTRRPPPRSVWQWLTRAVPRPAAPRPVPRRVVGYIGFWLIMDEAHISTIAVHPDWRGHGIGEQLVLDVLTQAARANALLVTLEVRAGNTAAQNLYRKHAFAVVGRRKRYYRDNHEDALLMTATLDDARRAQLLAAVTSPS